MDDVGIETMLDREKIADAPEWVVDFVMPPKQPKQPAQVPRLPLSDVAENNLRLKQRADAYLAEVPQSLRDGEGRSIAAFKLAGNLAALDNHGARLTDADVLRYCEWWNARNLEPLTQEKLREQVRCGLTKGTPRTIKPAGEITREPIPDGVGRFCEILIGGVVVDVDVDDDAPKDPGPLPLELMADVPGLVADVVAWCRETAVYYQPEAAFAGALSLMSAITGRKVRTRSGLRTNLFVLSLCASGGGKDRPRRVNTSLLTAAGLPQYLQGEQIKSAAGLLSALEANPTLLVQQDEVGHLLAAAKDKNTPWLAAAVPELLKLYTTAGHTYNGNLIKDRDSQQQIVDPHLVIFGTSTVAKVWGNLTRSDLEEGLAARFLILEAGTNYPACANREADQAAKPPESLVAKVRQWGEFSPSAGNLAEIYSDPIVVAESDTANATLWDWTEAVRARCDREDRAGEPHRAALWSRAGEKAFKLAALYACSRDGPERPEIDDAAAAWGIAVSSHLTKRMWAKLYMAGDSRRESDRKKLLDVVEAGGRAGLRSSKLKKKSGWLAAKARDELLRELEEMGSIVSKTVSTRGRPALVYYSTRGISGN